MKALEILKTYHNLLVDNTMDLCNGEVYEAIAELEALQQRSCQNCKHWKVRNTLVVSNECFRWSGNVMTPKDFCCNRHEPKEQ